MLNKHKIKKNIVKIYHIGTTKFKDNRPHTLIGVLLDYV